MTIRRLGIPKYFTDGLADGRPSQLRSFVVPSYSTDIDIDDDDQDMVLPMPRIPTFSPPSSSPPPAQPQFVDTGAYNLKRPRAPVAADLDTANILPSEHRRKRMKPARVTHTA